MLRKTPETDAIRFRHSARSLQSANQPLCFASKQAIVYFDEEERMEKFNNHHILAKPDIYR